MEIKIVGLIGVLHKRYGAYIQNQSLVHTNNRQPKASSNLAILKQGG
jgi:hypothetical protein